MLAASLSSYKEHGPLEITAGWNSKQRLPGKEGLRWALNSGQGWRIRKDIEGQEREELLGTRQRGQHPISQGLELTAPLLQRNTLQTGTPCLSNAGPCGWLMPD